MTKQGLRGFAGGLIVATLLLSYVYFYHSDKSSTPKITAADIENYAEKNDLVFISKEEYNNLTKQKDSAAKPTKQKAQEKTKDKRQPAESKTKNEEHQLQERPVAAQLVIKPGMSTSDVAEALQKMK